MSNKNFNDAFRRAMRHYAEAERPVPPPQPDKAPSIDGGAGTNGDRTPEQRPSMNDLIRTAARERE